MHAFTEDLTALIQLLISAGRAYSYLSLLGPISGHSDMNGITA